MLKNAFLLCATLLLTGPLARAQTAPAPPPLWHNQPRTLRYHPEGSDFVITNGTHCFTRALYGTNTAFRVEAGDLPEFALYLPGMGGNLKFGLLASGQSKWLIKAESITARYRPGLMLYDITDPLLGPGKLHLEVLARADAEGLIVKARFENVPANSVRLLWAFGGATGKKFSRDGDIGADPESSFYLKPEYCQGNAFELQKNSFTLSYGTAAKPAASTAEAAKPTVTERKTLVGVVPPASKTHIADATQQETPQQLLASSASATPVLAGTVPVKSGEDFYFAVQKPETAPAPTYAALPATFAQTESARAALAGRIKVSTPDPYINTLGGALAVAADAIWEAPSYLHGAVAWRIRLDGWRGPYAADPLGWHDRAATHFRAYAKSQLTGPPSGPVTPDTALHMARQLEKLGTAVFSEGYIARNPGGEFRAHHYDMNLVVIDELLRHFNWTGDLQFAREMWPVLQRHLAWEKRNFDPDNDGLYDAYAAIWASDALQYSGGAVTHTSAYNYFANQKAAELARLLGENPAPYHQEAQHIHQALQSRLWLPAQGWYAEYQDALGLQSLHPAAGLWTIYHALDSEVPDAFQAYQALRYVDAEIPHIPVRAAGLPDAGYYLLSTTNWQPYDWSLNNVVLAENLHTSLANWQAGRREEAFLLWKSALLESKNLGSSPGNFQQISFYDTYRGELYRDFADPVGMAARSLVEGLFGIRPDALHDTLRVSHGLPAAWDSAALQVPDVAFRFRRQGRRETYTIAPHLPKQLALQLRVPALASRVASLKVNGQPAAWHNVATAVGRPVIEIKSAPATNYVVEIEWQGEAPDAAAPQALAAIGAAFNAAFAHARIIQVSDPQQVLRQPRLSGSALTAQVGGLPGSRTAFVQLQQDDLKWWEQLKITVQRPAAPAALATPATPAKWETVDLTAAFNDRVTQIFRNKYLTPRPAVATLELPTQGIGNWCYPLTQANIDDSGLRQLAGPKSEIQLPEGVPLRTPGTAGVKNVLFVSQWDNYPHQATLPLRGRARRAVLLLAGSTNAMQSQFLNGEITITYADNTTTTLPLRNPGSWWPIEQDYLDDGFAFQTGAPKPYRVHLKTGLITRDFNQYTSIKGFSTRAIDGGAATVLELPLDPGKKLKSLTLEALANDVVIGLMSVTLNRN
ncbi:MAG: glycogen debranching protein [Hymenobacter sp.]|nr:glycogen debranching protein [Hymenobacter sp.]